MVINGSKKYNRQGLVLPCYMSPLQKSCCQMLPMREKQSCSYIKPPCRSEGAAVVWHWAVHQNECATMHTLDVKLLCNIVLFCSMSERAGEILYTCKHGSLECQGRILPRERRVHAGEGQCCLPGCRCAPAVMLD